MYGFEQIKSFYSWVFNNPDKVKPTHISLYLFLLNQNNRSMRAIVTGKQIGRAHV